jgi:hypothetical protein
MARLSVGRKEQVERADLAPTSGTGGVVAVILFVVGVAALGEVPPTGRVDHGVDTPGELADPATDRRRGASA